MLLLLLLLVHNNVRKMRVVCGGDDDDDGIDGHVKMNHKSGTPRSAGHLLLLCQMTWGCVLSCLAARVMMVQARRCGSMPVSIDRVCFDKLCVLLAFYLAFNIYINQNSIKKSLINFLLFSSLFKSNTKHSICFFFFWFNTKSKACCKLMIGLSMLKMEMHLTFPYIGT